MDILLFLIILLFSVVVHEVSHGLIADRLGDPTARLAGRLTLNPIPHIDPFGSILLPGLLLFIPTLFGAPPGFVFGWAKPVPVNYYNLRNPRRDMALVSFAGPASNIILAIACALPIRFGLADLNNAGGEFLLQATAINLILAIFNLIPIPPLDGSKIFASILSDRFTPVFFQLERYGFLIIMLLIFTGIFNLVVIPVLNFFMVLLVGMSAL